MISLEKGAHDYMTKPIELRELLLRMRRMMASQSIVSSPNETIWAFGEIKVDQALRAIIPANGNKNVPPSTIQRNKRSISDDMGSIVSKYHH